MPSRRPRRPQSPPPPPPPPPAPTPNAALQDYLSALSILEAPSSRLQTLEVLRADIREQLLILSALQATARRLLSNLLCIPGAIPPDIEAIRTDVRMRVEVLYEIRREVEEMDVRAAVGSEEGFRAAIGVLRELDSRTREVSSWVGGTVEMLRGCTMPDRVVEEWLHFGSGRYSGV